MRLTLISAKNLHIVDIEEVIFTVNGVEESLAQESPNDEVLLPLNDIQSICSTLHGDEILRWKLGTPKTVQNDNRMEMQIRFALKLNPMAAPLETETFNLHYMELHALGTMNSSEDPIIRFHCPPYNWALAIRRDEADDTIPYTISESSDYLVIYRAAIELWDLTNSTLSRPANASATTKPFSISAADLKHLSLSISWDGSQIVVSGENVPFKLYERNRPTSVLEELTKAESTNLGKFEGLGSFHKGAGNQRKGQEDEIFVAVDQNTASIHRVYGAWEFLRTIHHTSPLTSEIFWSERSTSRSIGDRIQGRHFICCNIDPDDSVTGHMTQSVFIWNLDSGRL
ncbi:hypothetical protein BGZ97_003478 [Linnemannia gamsii]|uniref:Uncharacterized protein n=1 Tax=Linnemannia gamsii TaxID=64522 RepID=A0A9P6RH99_9FUNG|nr:hypothetical protein BGZ97_003478 [Linnemannia gamsii]